MSIEQATTAAEAKPEAGGNKFVNTLLHWAPTLVFNIAGPIYLYGYLTHHGWSKAHALMLASLLPLVEIVAVYAIRKRIDDFGVFTIVTMALTLLTFLGFNSARAILLKDSILTGTIGLGILATLFLSRPFAFYMGRKFATDGTPEAAAWWNDLWQYPGFRRTQNVITIGWGAGLLAEAVIRVVLTYALSVDTMVKVTNIGPYIVIGVLVLWTITYARRKQAQSAARFGTDVMTPPSPPTATA